MKKLKTENLKNYQNKKGLTSDMPKKLLLIPVILLISLFLVACSRAEQVELEQVKLQYFEKEGFDSRKTIYYQKDKVIKEVTETVATYDYWDSSYQRVKTDETLEEYIKNAYEYWEKDYNSLNGVSYSYDLQEGRIVSTIEVDYTKLPLEKITALIPQTDVTTDNYVSYQKLLDYRLKQQHYKLIENDEFQELTD